PPRVDHPAGRWQQSLVHQPDDAPVPDGDSHLLHAGRRDYLAIDDVEVHLTLALVHVAVRSGAIPRGGIAHRSGLLESRAASARLGRSSPRVARPHSAAASRSAGTMTSRGASSIRIRGPVTLMAPTGCPAQSSRGIPTPWTPISTSSALTA